MDKLISEYKKELDSLQRQLDMLLQDGMRTHQGSRDTTQQTIGRVKRWRDELNQIITDLEDEAK
jgi:uncharacterized coiled-coil DUF342 family protein